ncbi:hypothetical protein JCM11641_004144 [Rhodosporidiobolus odoratus]
MVSCQRCRQPISPTSFPSLTSPHSRSPSHPQSIHDSTTALSPSTYDFLSQSERGHQPSSTTPGYAGGLGGRRLARPSPPHRVPTPLQPLYTAATRPPSPTRPSHRLVVPSPFPPTSTSTPSRNPLPTDSFIVLTDSVLAPPPAPHLTPQSASLDAPASSSLTSTAPPPDPTALTPRLSQLSHLYTLLSSTSSIDHPLCTECTEIFLALMQKELDEGKKEKDRLAAFEREVNKRREDAKREGAPTGEALRTQLDKDIVKLKKAEAHAISELTLVEAKKAELADEANRLDEEESELAKEEAEFWTSHSLYTLKRDELLDRSSALSSRLANARRDFDRLQRTNVYNDAFCIGQEAGFATINGLRLGRLPGVHVDWPEINAAWGHTLLLLLTISRKFGYEFEGGYRLVPCGSFSRIERREREGGKWEGLELYSSPHLPLTRLLHHRKFDLAMVAFLECLRQLIEWVCKRDRGVSIPHAVNKDKIGDVSIKLQFGSDEAWTRALRHVLLDLKILLSRASL